MPFPLRKQHPGPDHRHVSFLGRGQLTLVKPSSPTARMRAPIEAGDGRGIRRTVPGPRARMKCPQSLVGGVAGSVERRSLLDAGAGLDEPAFVGEDDRLHSIVELKLPENVRHVCLHGRLA
jgi:hypothetical protein